MLNIGRLKVKGWKKTYPRKMQEERKGVGAISVSDKIKFKIIRETFILISFILFILSRSYF